jgi:hypothetical protein
MKELHGVEDRKVVVRKREGRWEVGKRGVG